MQCLYFLDYFLDVSKHRIRHLCIKKKACVCFTSYIVLPPDVLSMECCRNCILVVSAEVSEAKPYNQGQNQSQGNMNWESATTFQPECCKRQMEILLNPAHHRHTQGASHRQQDHKEVQTISSKQRQNKPYPPHGLSDVLDCAH